MIDLRSKSVLRLLAYYFTNPAAHHYLRELAELLGVDAANLLRVLRRLEREGLFVSERNGRERYFRLNRHHAIYPELRGIVFKTVGVPAQLRGVLAKVQGVKEAYLYGSFARNRADAASDIDLLIVGNPESEELEAPIRRLEKRFRREVNYTLLTPEEFKSRRARKDAFLEDVWRHKRITLVSSP
jgi:predicted nucleotidyltransferase